MLETCELNGKTFERAAPIAARLGYSEWYMIKMGNTGKVPSVKLGRVRWFNYDEVVSTLLPKSVTEATENAREPDNVDPFGQLDGI